MKRRIEQRTVSAGTDEVEVKTGRGGIRDIEFVVQFLQLLHGGQYPEVRHANTLAAMARLEGVGLPSRPRSAASWRRPIASSAGSSTASR